MINLTPRLQKVAEYVREGVVLADIGTDHAYIPVYLILNGKIKSAYACDINEGPLQNAGKVIAAEEAEGITLVLSDGLSELEPDCADDIVIAGMGGELISDILARCEWIKNEKYNLVLQPMTRAEELRKYLCGSGFEIEAESFAREKDKLYSIIKARYTGKIRSISDAEALLGKAVNDDLYSEKAERELVRLFKKLKGLQKAGLSGETEETIKIIDEIKGIIDDNRK